MYTTSTLRCQKTVLGSATPPLSVPIRAETSLGVAPSFRCEMELCRRRSEWQLHTRLDHSIRNIFSTPRSQRRAAVIAAYERACLAGYERTFSPPRHVPLPQSLHMHPPAATRSGFLCPLDLACRCQFDLPVFCPPDP